jgi:hypothetical protein
LGVLGFTPTLGQSGVATYGDTCSKTFFDFHQIEKKKTFLKELEVDGGTIFDEKDLSHYITRFYANLYESETHALGHKRDVGRAFPPGSRWP